MELSLYDQIKFHALSASFEGLKAINNRVLFNGQEIRPITRNEYDLLKHSYALFGLVKREVLQICLELDNGHKFFSKIIKGTHNRVSTYAGILSQTLELESQARRFGGEVIKLSLSHTHLSQCEVAHDRLRLCMLSESDMKVVKRLKEFRNYPIEIKAIAKDGLVFKKIF